MIIVAGHICLDIIPKFLGPASLDPGSLVRVGAATLATGGVSNVGVALRRLGVPVKLLHRIGDDLFGQAVRSLLGPELAGDIRVVQGETTSYSVVVAPPGVDRMFIHCPGANDAFGLADVPASQLAGATHLHLGYPPVMRSLLLEHGAVCAAILSRAKSAGLTTSLDLCSIDPASPAGQISWDAWLKAVLPTVDLFTPSYDELAFILRQSLEISPTGARRMIRQCLAYGARAVLLKMGEHGLFYGDQTTQKYHPCFEVNVVTANGAGDCTIAGFLAAMHAGVGDISERLRHACAVGASCCEAADATSGVQAMTHIQERLAKGWALRAVSHEWETS